MSSKINCEKVDNCFANARTYRYYLPSPSGEELVECLGKLGSLFVKKNLRRPFFRVETDRCVQIKGIFGDKSMKVSFPEENWEEEKARWEQQLEKLLEEN